MKSAAAEEPEDLLTTNRTGSEMELHNLGNESSDVAQKANTFSDRLRLTFRSSRIRTEPARSPMASEVACWFLVRLLLPLSLLIACCLQFDIISLVYLILLLICPTLPSPSRLAYNGSLGVYLKACVVLTMLAMLPAVGFQIVLASMPPYGHFLKNCEFLETLLRHLGLISLQDVSVLTLVFYIVARLLPALVALVTLRECRQLLGQYREGGEGLTVSHPLLSPSSDRSTHNDGLKYCIVTFLTLVSLAAAAVARPSLVCAFYLLVLMGAMSWWACARQLGRPFGVLCRLLMVYSGLHVTALYLYQMQWPQQLLAPQSLAARLIGLVDIRVTNCTDDPRTVLFAAHTVDVYLYPILVYLLYYMLAMESRIILTARLVTAVGLDPGYQSMGDVVTPGEETVTGIEEDPNIGKMWDRVSTIIYACWNALTSASFLAAYIVMMYWSIKFHSWPTLVFLVWALLVAVVRNQRRVMYRSCPLLVVYAQLLVLVQYAFSLDLTAAELPDTLHGFSLHDVVLRPAAYPCRTLALQLAFTAVFWMTLRQYLSEGHGASTSSTTTQDPSRHRRVSLDDGFLKRCLSALMSLVVRLWIVLLTVLLFVYGVGQGQEVNLIQIVYMAFFLFFVCLFQISFRLWRRLLYGFVTVLILYQMTVLVCIYLYQFDQVNTWLAELGVSKQWQHSIGLEVYDTGRLFVKLLFPTMFMIVCVIYAQHVHPEFMSITDLDNVSRMASPMPYMPPSAGVQDGGVPAAEPERPVSAMDSAIQQQPPPPQRTVSVQSNSDMLGVLPEGLLEIPTGSGSDEPQIHEQADLTEMSHWLLVLLARIWNSFAVILDRSLWLVCRLIEIHSIKANILAVVLAAVLDVCAVHTLLILLACITLQLGGRGRQLISSLMLCWVSLLMMLRVVYQMNIIPSHLVTVNCTWNVTLENSSEVVAAAPDDVVVGVVEVDEDLRSYSSVENSTDDALVWLGVEKRSDLLQYLAGYIAVLVVFTIHKCVRVRGKYVARRTGHVLESGVVFSSVTRAEADADIFSMMKYLVNYGFYKFGVELCLIALVTLIASRLDVVALLYVVWLCALFSLHRDSLARVWPGFVVFIALLVCLQYLVCLGLPPVLCINYPFVGHMSIRLRMWLFLPDYLEPPHADLLIADVFLLLLVSCQKQVFYTELSAGDEYPGGSNKPVNDIQLKNRYFNPVPDYNATKGDYLDVSKRVLFFSSFWLTLAVVFLAGTSRITLFSLLYVVSAFVFLWKGNDFYLLPHRDIRRRWLLLLTYNVVSIAVKSTALQVMGCLFLPFFTKNACWLAQLLGVGCLTLRRLQSSDLIPDVDDTCHVPHEEAGLLWDGLVFTCLILQLRFYTSHYFQHLVEETRAQQILANCGAALIRRELKKKIQHRRAEEEQAMGDIQNKMERIKEQRIVKKRQKYENHYRETVMLDVIHSCAAEDLEMDLQRETVRRRTQVSPRRSTDAERAISPSELLMTGLTRDLNQAARHATRVRTQSGRITGGARIGGATGVLAGGSTVRSTSPGGSRYRARSGDSADRTPTSSLRRRRPQLERARSHYTPAGAAGGRVGVSRMQSEPPGGCPPLPTVHSQDSTAELLPESGRTTPDPQPDESVSADLPQERVDVETAPNENAISNLIRRLILAMKASGHFSLEMMASVVISVTTRLNESSEDYRFIARQLAHKKRRLKMAWRARGGSSHTGSGSEPPSTSAAVPAGSGYSPLPSTSMMADDDAAVAPPVSSVAELAPLVSLDSDDTSHQLLQPVNQRSFDYKLRKACGEDYADDELVEEDVSSEAADVRTSSAHRIIEQLAVAVWYAMVSNSELVAYIVVFINQLVSASILSLPLPLMVFLWGSLSVPRPSKTFWVTMIAYVETVIIIKYMFQFEFFPWNQVDKGNAPFWPPRILGIEQRDHYALYDLILLLIIFFHRLVLMTLGLWKDVEEDDLFADSAGKLDELKGNNDATLNGVEANVQPDGGVVEASAGALALLPDAPEDHLAPERKTAAERSREVANRAKNEMVEGFKYYMSAVKEFFVSLIFDASKEKVDVYAYMFFCDFINIFVIFMGFSSFGPPQGAGGGDISSVVEDNKVPIPFLIILSLNFLLILADRGIYLRKSIMWKVIFQYLLVFMLHGWLFFILPAMTGREFSQALAPRVWYMIKCVYLLFSAYQIRSGYPTRILGNFLTKQYTVINKTAFRCFMIIPFLYELRALMDWLWTKTSLDIFNWLKMEDIYAHIFISKCQRVQEESEVYVSGEPRRSHEKCMLGGGWLVMIVAVIFAPLVLFALSNAVGLPNPPREVQLELSLASYERLFQIRTGQNGIHGIDEIMYNTINYQYRSDRAAQGFLGDYDYTDITTIKMSGHSTAVWAISPPAQRRMADDLASNASMSMLLSWNIRRLHETKGVSALSAGSREFQLPAYTAKGTRNPLRDKLVRMLRGEESAAANVTLNNIFPKFLRVTNQGKAELPEGLEDPRGSRGENNQPTDYRNLILRLVRDNSTDQQWWQLSEDCSDGLYDWISRSCEFLEVLLFNQRAFPSTLSFITGAGIIGTYTTFVLLIGRLCRSSFVDISFHIMFDDMPYVDRILQICEDIYLVRERGNLILEEELFAKLIFLYRSPEMLIKYTEPPRPDQPDDVEADADQAGIAQLQQ